MSSSHVERLHSLLRQNQSASSPEMKAILTRVAAENSERTKSTNAVDYFVSLSRGLRRIKGVAHAELRVRCLTDCASFLFAMGHLKEGLESTKALRDLAHATDNKRLVRVAETISGLMYADCGDVAAAIVHYASAIAIATEANEVDGHISTLVNLGAALNYAGLYAEAIPCLLK